VRSGCAAVAESARFVHLDRDALQRYARALPIDAVRAEDGPLLPQQREPETLCAFVLALDAVNFGSGYFPHLAKRRNLSGYRTVEAALIQRFGAEGPITAQELATATDAWCAELFGQNLASEPVAELMQLFARAWRDLGALVEGPFLPFVAACEGSAAELVRRLCGMQLYRDWVRVDGLLVPFLKRAQLTVADLHAALPEGIGRFADLDELTLFADNLVPHVLRLDGLLVYDPELLARIDAGALIESGSREEIEIRAGAVHAVELLSREVPASARELDYWLWKRGGGADYKARPRHRTRCTFY
jgi:hypothetical protein